MIFDHSIFSPPISSNHSKQDSVQIIHNLCYFLSYDKRLFKFRILSKKFWSEFIAESACRRKEKISNIFQSEIHFFRWWSRPGMIRRHADFQSAALPAELPDHFNGGSYESRTRLASVTGRHHKPIDQ